MVSVYWKDINLVSAGNKEIFRDNVQSGLPRRDFSANVSAKSLIDLTTAAIRKTVTCNLKEKTGEKIEKVSSSVKYQTAPP